MNAETSKKESAAPAAAAEAPKMAEAPKPEMSAPAAEEAEPAEAKMASAAPAPDAKSESKPESKPEPKPEAKQEAKPEAKTEAKPEMKSETRPQPKAEAKPGEDAVKVEAWRDSEGLRLTFTFPSVTPAASFRRGDTVWLMFDSTVRSTSSRSAPRAARSSARSAGCRWRRGRRSASASTARRCIARPPTSAQRRVLDALLRRQGAEPAAAPDGGAQHHRSRARQCRGAARQSRPAASAGRSRCGRHAAGRHRTAADPRLHQAAGFRRLRAARYRPWRRDPAKLRRGRRRDRAPTRSSSASPAG